MSTDELFIFEDIVQYYKDELNPHKLITSHIKYWWYYFTAVVVIFLVHFFFIIKKDNLYFSLAIFINLILVCIAFSLLLDYASKKILKNKYDIDVKKFNFNSEKSVAVRRLRTSMIQDFFKRKNMLTPDIVIHLIECISSKKQYSKFSKYFATGLFFSAAIPLYIKFLDWRFKWYSLNKIQETQVYSFIFNNFAAILCLCVIVWEIRLFANIKIDSENKTLNNLADHLNDIYLNLMKKKIGRDNESRMEFSGRTAIHDPTSRSGFHTIVRNRKKNLLIP